MSHARVPAAIRALVFVVMCLVAAPAAWAADAAGSVKGVVRDSSDAVVVGADVVLLTAQQTSVRSTRTGADGRFVFENVPSGRYVLLVSFPGFAERRAVVSVGGTTAATVDVTLDLMPVQAEVTVTATPGLVQDIQVVS